MSGNLGCRLPCLYELPIRHVLPQPEACRDVSVATCGTKAKIVGLKPLFQACRSRILPDRKSQSDNEFDGAEFQCKFNVCNLAPICPCWSRSRLSAFRRQGSSSRELCCSRPR